MKTALIGYTGFVGSNLLEQFKFDDVFNSKNISEIRGKKYDLVVCAGVKAVKWWSNQNPVEDSKGIHDLIENIKDVDAKKFILISTVDVYPQPINVDEDFDFSTINQETYQAYGRNRHFLENFIKVNFEDYHIVRLPGLFGKNLKKNIIFDLLHNNQTEKIIPNCKFQYYFLGNIWNDIQLMIKNNIKEMNFNSEPIESSEIINLFFNRAIVGERVERPTIYDYKTKYDGSFGGSSGYMYTKNEVLSQLGNFISNNTKIGN